MYVCAVSKGRCTAHAAVFRFCEHASIHPTTTPRCNPTDFLEDNLYDAHVGKSMYALQLERWFAVFGRDRFKVEFTGRSGVWPGSKLVVVPPKPGGVGLARIFTWKSLWFRSGKRRAILSFSVRRSAPVKRGLGYVCDEGGAG